MCNMGSMSNIMLPLSRWKFSYQLRRGLSTCGAKCFRFPLSLGMANLYPALGRMGWTGRGGCNKSVSCQKRKSQKKKTKKWTAKEKRPGLEYYWWLSLLTHGHFRIYEAFPSETHCKIYFRFIYAMERTDGHRPLIGVGKYNCVSHLMRAANNELGEGNNKYVCEKEKYRNKSWQSSQTNAHHNGHLDRQIDTRPERQAEIQTLGNTHRICTHKTNKILAQGHRQAQVKCETVEYINDNVLEKIDVESGEESARWAADRHLRHSTHQLERVFAYHLIWLIGCQELIISMIGYAEFFLLNIFGVCHLLLLKFSE